MTSDSNPVREINRRRALQYIGAAGVVGLAGCSGGDGGNGGDGSGGDGSGDGSGDGTGDGSSDGGTATGTPTSGGDSQYPEAVFVHSWPETGSKLFRDYYDQSKGTEDVLLLDSLADPELPSKVGYPMDDARGLSFGPGGPGADFVSNLYDQEHGGKLPPYGAQAFDATALMILANAAAGENNGPAVRDQLRNVANPGGTKYTPAELPQAVEAAANGEQVDYQGASHNCNFNKYGDPAATVFRVWKFGDGNLETVTEKPYVNPLFEGSAAGGPRADSIPGGTGRTAKVGILLPQTGGYSSIGQRIINAATLPITQVNDADVSIDVDHQVGDTQSSRQGSINAANNLVSGGYPSVVGTYSSANNVPVCKQVLIPNEIVGCSPSSTVSLLTDLDDNDFVYRIAPSNNDMLGFAAWAVAEHLGDQTSSLLYLNDTIGKNMADIYPRTYKQEYDGEMVASVGYNKGSSSYTSVVQKALNLS